MARLTPPKSPLVCDKHKSGCMWSLYSIFEFRHGNSRKLISDRKHLKRDVVDDEGVKQSDIFTKFDEKCQGKDDKNENLVGPCIQQETKLKREEASTSEHGQLPKNFPRPSRVPLHGQTDSAKQKQPPYPKPVGKSFNQLESAASAGTLHKKKQAKKRRGCGCKNVDFVRYDQLNEINPQLLKVNDATEAIVNRKFIEGKYLSGDGVNQHSKQLLDALEILNSNKELFSKLLQDPNSLLVKHIQDLRDSQAQNQQTKSSSSEANISEHQTRSHRQHEEPGSSQKDMSSDKCQSRGRSDRQSSEIVVLKPGLMDRPNSADKIKINHCSSPQPFHSFGEHVESGKPASFSFDHIKRKFKHAMGVTRKDQHLMSNKGMEIIRRKSQNTIHVERGEMEKISFDIHRREKINKLKDFKARIGNETASSSESGHDRSESRLYAEDQKEDKFFHKHGPKALQRTAFSPEHDFLPLHNPRRDVKTDFGTSHMRFAPYDYGQVAYENANWRLQKEHKISYSSSLKQNLEAIIEGKKSKSQLQAIDSSIRGETNTMDIPFKLDGREENATKETTESRDSEETSTSSDSSVEVSTAETSDIMCQEATDLSEVPSELCDTDKSSTSENTDTTNTNEEDEYLNRSRLDSSFEDQQSTCSTDVFPSTPSRVHRVEDHDSIKDIGDQSSPISVLEQFFTDVASPPSTLRQPAEEENFTGLVKSLLDSDIKTTTSLFVYGSISEYVKAVLQASGLNWDGIDFNSCESDQLLDPSLLDSVKLQDNQFCGECELLFDCISEVLLEVYDSHFRSSPWLSFIKPKILQPLQVENFVIQEVMRRVDGFFWPQSLPITLDLLVRNDLRRSGTWLDIQADVEDMVSEMVEGALEELIMETVVDMQI